VTFIQLWITSNMTKEKRSGRCSRTFQYLVCCLARYTLSIIRDR